MERVDLAAAVAHLRAGGIVLYPTGSFLAAGVLAHLPEAVARLRRVKGRPGDKPFGVIVGSRHALEGLGLRLGPGEEALAARFWPGPLSLVLAAGSGRLAPLYPGGTVAVRVPGHPLARRLAGACGNALTATSANLAGRPPASRAAALEEEWQAAGALLLGEGVAGGLAPSTLVQVCGDEVRILRPGRIGAAALAAVWPPRPAS
jgi:L-threonylcarbamoyladenylate synthase